MRLSENRIIAWLVLAACIIGSIFGFGGASLVRRRAELMDVFYNGMDPQETGRNSMDAYLDRAAECAQVMASEVQLHIGGNNPDAQEMLETLTYFGDDGGLDSRYEAYTRLQAQSDRLYNAMYAAQLSDEQRVNFKRAYDDFWGSDKYIRTEPYREMASVFNKKLKGFPAGVVASLLDVDELNSFGG